MLVGVAYTLSFKILHFHMKINFKNTLVFLLSFKNLLILFLKDKLEIQLTNLRDFKKLT